MFARKAVGIFFDIHRAIGVSFADTETDFLVLAYEYAHFLIPGQGGSSIIFLLLTSRALLKTP
jgi:hypothetical protein